MNFFYFFYFLSNVISFFFSSERIPPKHQCELVLRPSLRHIKLKHQHDTDMVMRQEQLQERKWISVKLVKYHSHSVPVTFQWWNLTDFVTHKRCKYDCRYWEPYGNVVPHLWYGLLVHLQKAFLLFFCVLFFFLWVWRQGQVQGTQEKVMGASNAAGYLYRRQSTRGSPSISSDRK